MLVAIRTPKTFLLLILIVQCSLAWQECSNEDSSVHRVCPTGNTCCLISISNPHDDGNVQKHQFGCIPSDMGKFNGTCCATDGHGGCAVGYQCSVDKTFISESEYICEATPSAPMADYITQRLPRYRLCSVEKSHTSLHGLEITQKDDDQVSNGQLAYYSSHGPIDRIPTATSDSIKMVWIFIHGSGLNADDYFCSALAATKAQTKFKREDVLVIAPWFSEDSDWSNSTDVPFLFWDHRDALHPWRYGADALNHNISSYTALDMMVQALLEKLGFRVKIVVSGHSSGGQMVQRWTFLTKAWNANNMKAVVANPSSYLYLTSLRKSDGSWERPCIEQCPQYDRWKWGLGDGGDETVPYRDRALPDASAAAELVSEFRHKEITYLAGSLDVCNETEPDLFATDGPHCHSHGLETTCMDELQGKNRMERSNFYLESLQFAWNDTTKCHNRVIVPGVGHDHSLMFNSIEGIEAIFGRQRERCGGSSGLASMQR